MSFCGKCANIFIVMIGKLKNNITRLNRDELTCKYKKKSCIYFAICMIILLLLPFTSLFNLAMKLHPDYSQFDDDCQIHIVDVGQALAVMIHCSDANIIYDTGKVDDWNLVDKYIDKILLKDGGNIDYMILSHVDYDHSGNANNILTKYHPKNIVIPDMSDAMKYHDYQYSSDYQIFMDNLTKSSSNILYNHAGLELELGNINCKWLAPTLGYYDNTNDYSAVVLIEYNGIKTLLTGDSGHNIGLSDHLNIEGQYLSYARLNDIDTDVDVLVAGHHGSKYSTSLDLLEALKPENIFVSVGKNTYGHPSNELYSTIAQYDTNNNTDLSNHIYTTLHNNNIVLNINGDAYNIATFDRVDNYLFVSFWIVDMVLFVPAMYVFLDSYIIYYKITHIYNRNHKTSKK